MGQPLELDQRSAELLAELVADRLSHCLVPRLLADQPLLDAATIARRIGRSREWVYRHATEMGAVSLGDGERPRLGFELAKVAEYLDACETSRRTSELAKPEVVQKRRRAAGGTNRQGGDFLPIRGVAPPE